MASILDDTEDIMTLEEALEVQELRENESMAVLGASDPENCSYSKGYLKRQALYACLTCNPKGAPFAQPAGVCLACSYHCHEGHELVELYTKRNFRCDCGNRKFPDNPCSLQKEKDDVNAENTYNQNYSGLYCDCSRPYPDPDSENVDAQVQCIICEDWFHFAHTLGHLNTNYDGMEDDFELVCGACVKRLDFLGHYAHLAIKPKPPVDVSTCAEENPQVNETLTDAPKVQSEDSSSQDSGIDSLTDSSSSDGVTCPILKNPKQILSTSDDQGVAWKGALRSALCRCATCLILYKDLKVEFLLDPEDTIEHYEALGKQKTEDARLSAEARINDQVNQLGHVGQIELAHGINHLKGKLADFLKEHAEKGTTVRREDIDTFFAGMKEEYSANKRRRLE